MKVLNLKDKSLMDIARNIASILGVPKTRSTEDRSGFIVERDSPAHNKFHAIIIRKLRNPKTHAVAFALELDEGTLEPREVKKSIKIPNIKDFQIFFPNVMMGEEKKILLKVVDQAGVTKQFEVRKKTMQTHAVRMESDKPTKQLKSYTKGTHIFSEGDTGEEMFIIQKGKVGMYKDTDNGPVQLAVLGAGSFFGEMALLGSPERSASAIVKEAAQTIVISKDLFEFQLNQIPSWFVTMFKTLVTRLKDTNTELHTYRDRLAQYETVDDAPPVAPPEDDDIELMDEEDLADEPVEDDAAADADAETATEEEDELS